MFDNNDDDDDDDDDDDNNNNNNNYTGQKLVGKLVSLVLDILALKEKNFDSYRFSGVFQVVCIYWERFRYHVSSSTTGNIQ